MNVPDIILEYVQNTYVIDMKFMWRVILKGHMQFHMNDTNRPS